MKEKFDSLVESILKYDSSFYVRRRFAALGTVVYLSTCDLSISSFIFLKCYECGFSPSVLKIQNQLTLVLDSSITV